MYHFIDLIRAFAALLITNSHFDSIYPISALATGGLIGNSLFFIVSGFCLTQITLPFFTWYRKRLIRVYPPVLIMALVGICIGDYSISNWSSFIEAFIWPTYFGFVGYIVLLYIPYYFVIKSGFLKIKSKMNIVIAILVWLALCVLRVFNINILGYAYYFLLMCAGAHINLKKIRSKRSSVFFAISIFLIVVYFGVEALIDSQLLLDMIKFVPLYIGVVLFIISLQNMESVIKKTPQKLWGGVQFLSRHTLEIYTTQVIILHHVIDIKPWGFKFLFVTIEILIAAYILRKIVSLILSILN